jgi:superfamily II DNA helicase RecQ
MQSNPPLQTAMGNPLDDESLLACATKYFGHRNFRGQQLAVMNALLAGNDVTCTMATGGGKSLLFQLPALALRDRVGILATTVVVSPLLSLIEDQVQSLRKQGVSAVAIGQSSSRDEEERAMRGEYTIIYATPEKISVWKYALERLVKSARVVCIGVCDACAILRTACYVRCRVQCYGRYALVANSPPHTHTPLILQP